jgi:hypothetical protein
MALFFLFILLESLKVESFVFKRPLTLICIFREGRSAKSYRQLGRKIKVHHNTVKKYWTKMRVHRKAKKSAPKTTARQKTVIKARLKLLTQNYFSEKSIYKCVIDDESYFTVGGNKWQQQSYYES